MVAGQRAALARGRPAAISPFLLLVLGCTSRTDRSRANGDASFTTEGGSERSHHDAAHDARSDAMSGRDGDLDSSVGGSCRGDLPGPRLVRVPTVSGGTYCIDSTEVTIAQYAEFLAATAAGSETAGQDPWCSWNTSYVPSEPSYAADWTGNYPVEGEDWCDAAAYCKWAGKHLCGRVDGGPIQRDLDASLKSRNEESEWVNACSRGGTRVYPYGNEYSGEACNDGNGSPPFAPPDPVPARLSCEGGYPGIYDMSGNVDEWIDDCNAWTGADDGCVSKGGSTRSSYPTNPFFETICVTSVHERTRASPGGGFRCCATSSR
jgi:sulfatase modifying factor 1